MLQCFGVTFTIWQFSVLFHSVVAWHSCEFSLSQKLLPLLPFCVAYSIVCQQHQQQQQCYCQCQHLIYIVKYIMKHLYCTDFIITKKTACHTCPQKHFIKGFFERAIWSVITELNWTNCCQALPGDGHITVVGCCAQVCWPAVCSPDLHRRWGPTTVSSWRHGRHTQGTFVRTLCLLSVQRLE